jgi:hypothetical protein
MCRRPSDPTDRVWDLLGLEEVPCAAAALQDGAVAQMISRPLVRRGFPGGGRVFNLTA